MGLLPFFGGWIFEVGEGLPALPTTSTGYHFPAGATADVADVARIAAILGVAGEPRTTAPETGNAWQVGPDDGSAPALYVGSDGLSSWYFSGPWAATSGGSCAGVDLPAEAPDAPEDGVRPIEECVAPEPPAGVPTADQAEAKARELLTALGEDPTTYQFETYADEWAASVTTTTTVDGLRWPVGYGFGFGAEGALQWANGFLADPVATGPYPLIDLDGALARLAEQNGMWGYGFGAGVAADARAAEEAAAAEEAGAETVADDVATEPAPSDVDVPAAEPVVATLVDVSADLWWVWDTDNSVWLLPAYTFTDTNGLSFTVPAVTDDYMIVVEAIVQPLPEPLPTDPGGTDVDPPSTIGDPAELEAFVGVGLKEFEDLAAGYGYTTRVARQDGEDLALTDDYSESRVNVAVEADVVVDIVSIG
jgi:hypothetical protein